MTWASMPLVLSASPVVLAKNRITLFVSIGLSTSRKITSTRMMKPWTTQTVRSESP